VKIADVLDRQWVRRGIALVPANGKRNIDRPVVVFRGFKIPTFFVFDGDVRHRGTGSEGATAKINRAYLRLAGAPDVVDFPSSTVSDTWGCFENEFEDYCQQEVGVAEFEDSRAAAAGEFGYDHPSEALKNFDVAASFVARLYAKGKRLPMLEDIVRRVTASLA
jgi:putative ATP-dependent endonuclease of the OLD family